MQYLHTMLLDLVISKSKLPKSLNSLSDLSQNCALYRYLKAMENDVFIGTNLRECAAIFSMYHLTEENLSKLPQLCHGYFTAVALFDPS